MREATLTIKMGNAAFTNSAYPEGHEAQRTTAAYELSHILEELAMKIIMRTSSDCIRAVDSNGNTVGYLTIEEKD
jgi:hypothetical protein